MIFCFLFLFFISFITAITINVSEEPSSPDIVDLEPIEDEYFKPSEGNARNSKYSLQKSNSRLLKKKIVKPNDDNSVNQFTQVFDMRFYVN